MTTLNELIDLWTEERRLFLNQATELANTPTADHKRELADQAMLIVGQLEELKDSVIPFNAHKVRDEAAIKIMAALSNNQEAQLAKSYQGYTNQLADQYAKVAVIFADALIKELNQ